MRIAPRVTRVFLAFWLAAGLLAAVDDCHTAIFIAWALSVIAFGLGVILKRPRLLMVCAALLIIASVTWLAASLPLYSMDWAGVAQLEISRTDEPWRIVITDPSELAEFEAFGKRGSHPCNPKSGYSYDLTVVDRRGRVFSYKLAGNGWGSKSPAMMQVIFSPARSGFRKWIESTVNAHLADAKRAASSVPATRPHE